MHAHLPPVVIGGFDHPQALDGLAVRRRPSWADHACSTCLGRGARNEILHLDSQRCRITACPDCSGVGWVSSAGLRQVPTVSLVNGHPAWTVAILDPRVIAMRPRADTVSADDDHADHIEALEAA